MGLIRLILAITVVIAHTTALLGNRFSGALVAVESFFMISGFYMSLILNKKYTGKNSYFLFISNRALRLFPAYWLVLILTVIFSLVTYSFFAPYGSGISHETGIAAWIYVSFVNITLIGQDTLLFLGIDPSTGFFEITRNFIGLDLSLRPDTLLVVPQAWSVSLEIMFYLIAPFLVRRKLSTVVTVLLCSLALRFFIYSHGLSSDPWNYRFFPTELMFFLMGNVSYRIYEKISEQGIKSYYYAIYGFILACMVFYNQIPTWIVPSTESKQLFFFILLMLSIPFIFHVTKNSAVDKQIGELSYPVYISHIFIVLLLRELVPAKNPYFGPLVVSASILFSIAVIKYIVDPIDAYRQRRIELLREGHPTN